MTYEISFASSVYKDFRKIAPRETKRIMAAIRALAENPRPHGVRKMKGKPYYRLRVGTYRVIYDINDSSLVVLVIEVGHRKEIYR